MNSAQTPEIQQWTDPTTSNWNSTLTNACSGNPSAKTSQHVQIRCTTLTSNRICWNVPMYHVGHVNPRQNFPHNVRQHRCPSSPRQVTCRFCDNETGLQHSVRAADPISADGDEVSPQETHSACETHQSLSLRGDGGTWHRRDLPSAGHDLFTRTPNCGHLLCTKVTKY